jgi:hypothetical protein
MATIVDNQNLTDDLVDGKITSSDVTDPDNVRVKFVVTNATSENYYFFATYFADDAPLTDNFDNVIKHKIKGNDTVSKNFLSINAATFHVELTPVDTHDGDITVTTVES